METVVPSEPPILTDADIGSAYLQAVSKEDGLSPLQSERLIMSHEQIRKLLKSRETELEQLRNRVQPLSDKAELADTYERWLIEIGRSVGCDHLDEQLQNCVTRVVQGEDEEKAELTAERDRLAKVLEDVIKDHDKTEASIGSPMGSYDSKEITAARTLLASIKVKWEAQDTAQNCAIT